MQNDNSMSPQGHGHAAGKLGVLLRESAQDLFARILAAECERFLRTFDDLRDERGRASVVRNGYQPTRCIETGIGLVPVRVPKLRNRTGGATIFRSSIVPRYVRRTRASTREAVWRYLYGIWCCNLNQVLVALLGARATHLAGVVPESVRSAWVGECQDRHSRPFGELRPIEIWAECISPDPGWCVAPGSMLAVVGVAAGGGLDLLGLDHGQADTHSRWIGVVQSLRSRGLQMPEQFNSSAAANGFGQALGAHTPEHTPELTHSIERGSITYT